jgi:hypothetical protein
MATQFKMMTLGSFNKLRTMIGGLSFTSSSKSDIKDISFAGKVDEEYRVLADRLVPTILGLSSTLPKLSKTLEKDMTFISNNKDIDTIMASIRMFITKPDHRLDVSRSNIDIDSKNVALEKRVDELGEHFDINKNEDLVKFKDLFGNMNTFK